MKFLHDLEQHCKTIPKCICKLTWQRKNTWKNHHSKMYFLKNADFSAIAIFRQLMCCSKWCFPMPFTCSFFFKFPLVCRSFGFLGVILECFFLMIFQQVVRNLFFLEAWKDVARIYHCTTTVFRVSRSVSTWMCGFCPWVDAMEDSNVSTYIFLNVGSRCHHLKNGETPFGWGYFYPYQS